jgi:uncharacterized protein
MLRQEAGITASGIYEGLVEHRRLSPIEHAFQYGLAMLYLDLDELPTLLRSGIGLRSSWFSPASFRREDHLGDPAVPLADAAREMVRARTGLQLEGPVRLLTLLRNFGYYFSPLSLYFCFDRHGLTTEAIVAEVTNTPWLERHWYVLWQGNRMAGATPLRFRHPKDFHVSPFMDMDAEYEWHVSEPGAAVDVSIASLRGGRRVFDVTLGLQRRGLDRGSMVRMLARHPWMTARVTQAIYWQAARLWRKGTPFYPHPESRRL